jgi:SAM-dependent methyltransferase
MGRGYNVLPPVYDRWQSTYGRDFTHIIAPPLLSTITRYKIPVSTVVDIGCGTGTLALLLAARGWKVYGVDASQGMIDAASVKTREQGVELSCQDMTQMTLREPVSLATSFFDTLNHLESRQELNATFQRVYDALAPGGLFVFDTSNERCYRVLWTKNEVVRHQDFLMILENSYIRRTRRAESCVTLFDRVDETYRRSEEIVWERYFPRHEVGSSLRTAGFRILEHREFSFTGSAQLGRMKTWWVARKGVGR